MSGLPIRYSPSGPIISNDDGGDAVPGPGFTLRIVDKQLTAGSLTFSGSTQAIPATGPSDFILAITNPKPGLRYGCELLVCAQNVGGAGANWGIGCQYRVDGGAFSPEPELVRFAQTQATSVSGQMKFQSLFRLGKDLQAPVLDASTLLEVQFTAIVTAGAAALTSGTLAARLYETL